MVYHPVLQEAATARDDTRRILKAFAETGTQILALAPNSDAGSDDIRAALSAAEGSPGVALQTHLARPEFIAAMARADLMVGNSSAGIIEAASFGTPVLNIGSRQNLRERNANVVDIPATEQALGEGVARLLTHGRYPAHNIYGDGRAAERIVALLANSGLDETLLMKVNGY